VYFKAQYVVTSPEEGEVVFLVEDEVTFLDAGRTTFLVEVNPT